MNRLYDFYDPRLYDIEAGDADPSPKTVAFYLEKAGLSPRRILDVGAGTGRLAIPLLRCGHHVICVDRSETMLGSLRARAQKLEPDCLPRLIIRWEIFTFRQHEAAADIALAMDDFLLHFMTLGDLHTFFHNLSSWLRPGGSFVTDIRPRRNVDLLQQASNPVTVRTFGITPNQPQTANDQQYCTVFWEQYDIDTRCLVTTCQYQMLSSDGIVQETYYRVLRQRIHSNAEVIHAASESGFRLVELSARNQPGTPPVSDIGGTFEFQLER